MNENLIDIEYLKSLGCQPKWFGLGFIQLKLDEKRRMHFWHPDLLPDDPAFVEEYHTHRYDFTSDILVGEITNHISTVVPNDGAVHTLYSVCCSGGGQEKLYPVDLTPVVTFTTKAGSSYFLNHDSFHRVTATRCVTLQTRGDDVKERAHVVQRNDTPSANPFNSFIDPENLWWYIADLLAPLTEDHVPAPGYHLAEIPKGVLGEASKIMEEARELLDACEQSARVMQLVELSDLMGAVEAFLENRHPGYTLDDLRIFSDITKRAFRNGRRG